MCVCVYVPRSDLYYAIGVKLHMVSLRHRAIERDGSFHVAEKERPPLEYYANAIALLVDALSGRKVRPRA